MIYWNTATSSVWKHNRCKNMEFQTTTPFLPINYTIISYLLIKYTF